jgi:hypothetical protein
MVVTIMNLEERINMLTIGILQGKDHLEKIYGNLEENLEVMDTDSVEFMFGHLTGMMEIIRVLLEGFEEE